MATSMSGAGPRVLIACVGNIFLGDDSFGVEVARRLRDRPYPQGVRVVDFGIRGVDLAYTLLDDYDALILVDAAPRGRAPGTLYLIEPDLPAGDAEGGTAGRVAFETHSMDPVKVLAYARALGARPVRTLIVGCEPAPPPTDGYHEMVMGLSVPVRAALDPAVEMIDGLVADLCASRARHGAST
jgi:hydrogenase maturation protease